MASNVLQRMSLRQSIPIAQRGSPAIIGPPSTRNVGASIGVQLQGGGSKVSTTATGQLALTTLTALILGLVAFHVWTREFQS